MFTKERGIKKKELLVIAAGILMLFQPLSAQIWQKAKRISWNLGSSFTPTIAVDSSNRIHVFWHDSTPGKYEIYYRKSTNHGLSWGTTQRLTWNPEHSEYARAAFNSSDHIHLVWMDKTSGNFEIYYKKSTNHGDTWGATKRLTWNAGSSSRPRIALDSNDVIHVVWLDSSPGNHELYHKKSTNHGSNWGTAKRLTWDPAFTLNPEIAMDSNDNIHIVWGDYSSGNCEIYHKKSTDGGTTWAKKRLSWNAEESSYAVIGIDPSGNIHVAWSDSSFGNFEIAYRRSTNGGTTWGTTKRLSWNAGFSGWPAIASDSNSYVHVLWSDNTPGYNDILYKRSTDGGITWQATKKPVSEFGDSGAPATVINSNNDILLVWDEFVINNHEIFFKKGIQ